MPDLGDHDAPRWLLTMGDIRIMALGVVLNLGSEHGAGAMLLSFALFGVGPVGVGWWMLRAPAGPASALAAANQAWDSELMRLAARSDDSLSVAEVVMHTELAASEAEKRLDDLSRRGLCELRVTEAGVVVYHFGPQLTREDKQRARGVLE